LLLKKKQNFKDVKLKRNKMLNNNYQAVEEDLVEVVVRVAAVAAVLNPLWAEAEVVAVEAGLISLVHL
jgi:hypothetical protein